MKASTLAPTRLGFDTKARWLAFRLLERISDLRGNAVSPRLAAQATRVPEPAVWVFASTLGELNAVEPLLQELIKRAAPLRLVLITDHEHYRLAYEARYPASHVCVTHGHGGDARALADAFPPRLLAVAEIPCLPHDAPCRFSFAFLLEAKRHGAPAVLVNGWLYHGEPACRMDGIETRWFRQAYVRAFDRLCVQTTAVRDELVGAGANTARVSVCGNVKFDATRRVDWTPEQARSPRMLGQLIASKRPIIVAGCVTDPREQAMVVQAFTRVRDQQAAALLVLAPRHPEVRERMQALRALLAQHGVAAAFRSEMEDHPVAEEQDGLVLDTMGDLRDFFAAATVAHMGTDHNVLEPLGFGKPTTVIPGWQAVYPSYPVYRLLMDEGLLTECQDAPELADTWSRWLTEPAAQTAFARRKDEVLARQRGAVDRHLDALDACLEAIR